MAVDSGCQHGGEEGCIWHSYRLGSAILPNIKNIRLLLLQDTISICIDYLQQLVDSAGHFNVKLVVLRTDSHITATLLFIVV